MLLTPVHLVYDTTHLPVPASAAAAMSACRSSLLLGPTRLLLLLPFLLLILLLLLLLPAATSAAGAATSVGAAAAGASSKASVSVTSLHNQGRSMGTYRHSSNVCHNQTSILTCWLEHHLLILAKVAATASPRGIGALCPARCHDRAWASKRL
jgi:hypothetical protein